MNSARKIIDFMVTEFTTITICIISLIVIKKQFVVPPIMAEAVFMILILCYLLVTIVIVQENATSFKNEFQKTNRRGVLVVRKIVIFYPLPLAFFWATAFAAFSHKLLIIYNSSTKAFAAVFFLLFIVMAAINCFLVSSHLLKE